MQFTSGEFLYDQDMHTVKVAAMHAQSYVIDHMLQLLVMYVQYIKVPPGAGGVLLCQL